MQDATRKCTHPHHVKVITSGVKVSILLLKEKNEIVEQIGVSIKTSKETKTTDVHMNKIHSIKLWDKNKIAV